ncbi:MAG: hypothetical protein V5A52_06900 [Halovenus sp.]
MIERFGLEQRDIRNMFIVLTVMTLIMVFLIEAPILPRIVAALIMALFSGVSFLVVTVLIKRFGPESY